MVEEIKEKLDIMTTLERINYKLPVNDSGIMNFIAGHPYLTMLTLVTIAAAGYIMFKNGVLTNLWQSVISIAKDHEILREMHERTLENQQIITDTVLKLEALLKANSTQQIHDVAMLQQKLLEAYNMTEILSSKIIQLSVNCVSVTEFNKMKSILLEIKNQFKT
jgi:hypothetical protein